MLSKRPVRVGNVSGATGDHPHAMLRMAQHGDVDVITGDWLSEMNIAWQAINKREDATAGYEVGFIEQLEESLDEIVKKGIKVVTNAGALNTPSLTRRVEQLCQERGYGGGGEVTVVVASVVGDDVSDLLRVKGKGSGDGGGLMLLPHLDHPERKLQDWELEPCCGNAYIGGHGIVAALEAGADIVICGRCTDASPVIAAAAWWHGWAEQDYDKLAGALVAGHLIECGPYVVGANFSGFKEFMPGLVDLAFPTAEIDSKGGCVITKNEPFAGSVTKHTVTAQFLYELQGHLYLNPDVVADLSNVSIEAEEEKNRVRVYGITGSPPPSTTKAMFAAPGGFQAETIFYINGLDVLAKAEMMKKQLEYVFKGNRFSKLSIELYGTECPNPRSQQAGTVSLRVFVQARRKEDILATKFKTPIYALRMQSYPGYHLNLDFRTMDPKPFMEIFPAVIPISSIQHQVILPSLHSSPITVPPPLRTAYYPVNRPSYETSHPIDLASLGATTKAPLGSIVHARSGDKADNSNVGFFVRHSDEYPWLQTFLTIDRLSKLFEDDWVKGDTGRKVERVEFPNILAVHFRILDFLDGGIASSSRIDGLGKGIGEYLRSQVVDIPDVFLSRGWI